MDWANVGAAAVTGLFTAVTGWLTFRAARAANQTTEENNDQSAALAWVTQFREEAIQARADANRASRDAQEAAKEAGKAWRYAHRMAEEVRIMRQTAWREDMTLARYREFLAARNPSTLEEGSVS